MRAPSRCLLVCLFALPIPAMAGNDPPDVYRQHYLCYTPTRVTSDFKTGKVGLVDQFAKSSGAVVKLVSVCNPVSKDESPMVDERTHLACYSVARAKPVNRRVHVRNQFGAAVVVLKDVSPGLLCVPSVKEEMSK